MSDKSIEEVPTPRTDAIASMDLPSQTLDVGHLKVNIASLDNANLQYNKLLFLARQLERELAEAKEKHAEALDWLEDARRKLVAHQSATPATSWPAPTEENAKSGWSVSFKYLQEIQERAALHDGPDLSLEDIEAILLAVAGTPGSLGAHCPEENAQSVELATYRRALEKITEAKAGGALGATPKKTKRTQPHNQP